ncbi:MAG: SPOR domain-containing protein [Bacteroidaceae bacterium]|nr:SPOR domain-containing protein [Bacteroidaceae bacterium]
MKKVLFMGSALMMVLAMTSCKSNESAYKKAYEKAQAAQTTPAQVVTTTPTQQTTPVQVTPVTPNTNTQTTTDYSNVTVRTEAVSLVSGAGLRAFSVVVGSFGLQSNAQTLQSKLASQGYAAQIVSAVVNGMVYYRVVASTHDTKEQAAQSRAALLGTYSDAWLLYQK